MGYLKQKFRNIKKFPNWFYWLPARLLWLYWKLFFRMKVVDPEGILGVKRGAVALAWHNRLMFFAMVFPAEQRRWTKAVVSSSRDGQYIADFIAQLGLGSLRGSSSKRGMHAQREALKAISDGYNVAFTPDGPRGPKYQLKKGPIALASMTGAPIVPISVNASRYWQIRSWDNFQIPKPFSTLTLEFGRSFPVPPDLDDAGVADYMERARLALMSVTRDRGPECAVSRSGGKPGK